MDSLEAFDDFGVQNADFLKTICHILKFLFDEEVLSEEAIVEWHSNPPNDPSALSVRSSV